MSLASGFKVEAVESSPTRTELVAYCIEHAPPEASGIDLEALPRTSLYCEECGKLLYSPTAPVTIVRVDGNWHAFTDPRDARAFLADCKRDGLDAELLREHVRVWRNGERPDGEEGTPL